MTRRQITRAFAAGALLAAVWGCGGSAATSQSAAAPSTSPAAAASTAVEPSVAQPSQAQPSVAQPSTAVSSFALPSFELPSGAKDLEALLPDELCGVTAIKLSMSGEQFMTDADAEFKATLATLGKQASDVSFAIAASTGSGCTAGIFRVKGIVTNLLEQALVAAEKKSGTTYTQGSVGGKNVYITDTTGATASKQYVYFKGDAAIFAEAKDEATATAILQQLP